LYLYIGGSLILQQDEAKENFVRLLGQSFIISGQDNGNRFNKTVNKVMMKHYQAVLGCRTTQLAADLYNSCAFFTTRTVSTYQADGIILDGEVPGAISTHAHFIRVLINDRIKVFKHPKDLNSNIQIEKINKDVRIFEELKNRNNGIAVPGLVCYESFTVNNTEGQSIKGHLSDVYIMTLADIRVGVESKFLCDRFRQVFNALKCIHDLGYVMCDVKPDNLFLKNDMTMDIADFGGCVILGGPIEEYTIEFMPNDFIHQGATFAVDMYCLASSFLFMMGKQVPDPSVYNITDAVSKLRRGSVAKIFLEEVLSTH